MNRFALTFCIVLLALFSVEMLNPVQQALIQPFTHGLAAASAALLLPFDSQVAYYGNILSNEQTGFAVAIESGCNGVEATIVLIAAVLAFPANWRQRLAAIVLGTLAVQLLNLARIISLFYLGQWNLDVFSWTHLYLWPVLIMLDVLVVFLLYLRYLDRGRVAPASA